MVSKIKDTLLLVGYNQSDRPAMREIFKESFHLLEAESLSQAALLLEQNDDCIAAVLIDAPDSSDEDAALIRQAVHYGEDIEIPVLLLISPIGDGSREDLEFSRGASDVIHKPYTPSSIRRRVELLTDLHMHKWRLQTLVNEQQKTIRNNNQVMLDALSAIIEHRNAESGNHILRIRRYTKILLEDIAQHFPEYGLTADSIDIISSAAALHDIGKIAIPDAILNKPGKLTDEEYEIMKTHAEVGGKLILYLSEMGDTEYLRYAYNIALYHHERWDGRGYPKGLSEDEIPICAQVVGLADVFDALIMPRVYKEAYPYTKAINMILNSESGVFSPKVIGCFKNVMLRFVELAEQYADGYSPKDDAIAMPLPGVNWQNSAPGSTQLPLAKYQAMLHYTGDTILELDMNTGTQQVVYNPNPELDAILPHAISFTAENITDYIKIHPDDQAAAEELRKCLDKGYFSAGHRRKNISCRIFISATGNYQHYGLTFLRVNTPDERQCIVFLIFHRVEQQAVQSAHSLQNNLYSAVPLRGLVSGTLRTEADKLMTIDLGTEDLTLLTGYTKEEIAEQFENKFLNMILESDREAFLAGMEDTLQKGIAVDNEFRILRKNNDPLWLLSKSRANTEADGQEYLYHAIRDCSKTKAIEYELHTRIERNQIIIDQMGGIVFEWNLEADTLYCSPKWKERFGYTPISKNYGRQMGIATHFHPDDLPKIRDLIQEIKTNFETLIVDVRIANSKAKYLWTRIIATAYLDEHGTLTKIIGILQDIDDLKQAELNLKERAERDSLTRLYNKEATQTMIGKYLAEREKDQLAALLMLDLDNFKHINDHYGHLYGDSVLTQIGIDLQQMFRSNDVIGRIGGDEFMIFLQDIPSKEMVQNRCELLLNTFRKFLEELAPELNVSCSIGVAMVPDDGIGYNELFKRADEALYLSKSRGKNTYTFYDSLQAADMQLEGLFVPTRIDSDTQPGMADASFVRFVFRQLYESNDIFGTFDDILSYVGAQLNVSRVYIFENNADNTTCSNTFEWCNEGISPEIDNLQNVSYIDDIAGWPDVFDERGVFYCTDITTLEPHFRAILEPQGIKSMLQCAIMDNGVFRGYVGFDDCTVNRRWTQTQVSMLQFLSEALSTFLLKMRLQAENAEIAENLRKILDRQDSWIYVIDPETCEIKFLNEKAKKSAKNFTDLPCYKAFRNRDTRCENCIAQADCGMKNGSIIIEDSCFGNRVRANSSEIHWDGKPACLVFCHELEE